MDKSTIFSGQPIFSQLLSFIPNYIVERLARKYDADRYCKKFDTRHHLVTMLFAVINQCTSIREVVTGLQVAGGKKGHFKMIHDVKRSTLSDANRRRPEALFGDLFHELYKLHYGYPDSRKINPRAPYEKRLFIIDSTTIRLFHDILQGVGQIPSNGKRKGGLKAHVMIKASEDTPCVVDLTKASANDRTFFKSISLPKGSIVTFDKGYANFRQFDGWTKNGVTWVSRILNEWIIKVEKEKPVSEDQQSKGVLADKWVIIGDPKRAKALKIKARIIKFIDSEKDMIFEFVTNNRKFLPDKIADIYKQRWQIELLFKRIKQRYPLRYFLGDNENAIKIQVWCALIADLLVKIIKDRTKRHWAYSNISGIIKMHLMTYVNLSAFLEYPEKALVNYKPPEPYIQLKLFTYT
jgi:hypothetical protein